MGNIKIGRGRISSTVTASKWATSAVDSFFYAFGGGASTPRERSFWSVYPGQYLDNN